MTTVKWTVEFGWGAAPFAGQLPELPADAAGAFDADNKAIIRLHVRGMITTSERDRAIKRVTDAIAGALVRAATPETESRDDTRR